MKAKQTELNAANKPKQDSFHIGRERRTATQCKSNLKDLCSSKVRGGKPTDKGQCSTTNTEKYNREKQTDKGQCSNEITENNSGGKQADKGHCSNENAVNNNVSSSKSSECSTNIKKVRT